MRRRPSEPRPRPALREFQGQLRVPALQLTDEGEGFSKVTNGDQTILVAPAWMWLPRLA